MSDGGDAGKSVETGVPEAESSSMDGMGSPGANGGGDLPFAATLFDAADRLRGSVESAEYKHLVLGLLFLKYVSDSYMRRRQALEAETHDESSGPDEGPGEKRERDTPTTALMAIHIEDGGSWRLWYRIERA
jgi:hypothetical protein